VLEVVGGRNRITTHNFEFFFGLNVSFFSIFVLIGHGGGGGGDGEEAHGNGNTQKK
jgi:hypothetical protein